MNRNTLLGFLAGLLFAGGVIAGVVAGDAVRDNGGGALEIPSARGERIPLIPGEDITGFDSEPVFAADAGFVPTEVAGEFVLLDEAPPTGRGGGGFAGDGSGDAPAAGGPAGDDTPGASTEGEPPPGEDRGYPWEVDDFPVSIFDLLFEDPGFPFLRFLDFCADGPEAEGCPPGTGGTVLVPLDDPLAIGEFELRRDLYSTRSRWWTCEAPSDLRSNEYLLLLQATHPARIEIDYYPGDDPDAVRSTVVDLTDPTSRSFVDFVAEVAETGGTPPTGVSHCFVLEADRRPQTYVIEARATSFTGETDSGTFRFSTREQRDRPPVQIAPLGDYEATLVVPVKSDPRQTSVVRLIRPEEGLGCTDIEDTSVIYRERRDVLPGAPMGLWSGYIGREAIGDDIVNAPDWRYDPAYDTYQFWTLNLEEGSSYRACVWWVDPLERSFDPGYTRIVDRETRFITTPDRLRASIRVAAIQAPSTRDLPRGSFSLTARSRCSLVELPTADMGRGSGVVYIGGVPFCDYLGYRQPALTELTAVLGDGTTRDFVIATPGTGEPRIERVRLDLSRELSSGLCGGSFGDCDGPTSIVPGPIVYLEVVFEDGGRSARPDWVWGEPFSFESPPRETPEIPEQPRMDDSSMVRGVRRDALRVTVNFDRPVTLQASLEGDLAEQCFTGEIPTFSSDEPRASYSFVMDGLCTYTYYQVRLEVTDEAGSTVVFTTSTVLADGRSVFRWGGDGRTLGYDVRYYPGSRSAILTPWETYTFDVRVGGRLTTLGGDDRCLTTLTTPWQTSTWGEEIQVEIYASFASGTRVDGRCTAQPPDRRWVASVTTSFTIEEFMAGGIEITFPLEPLGFATGIPEGLVGVVIRGEVLP